MSSLDADNAILCDANFPVEGASQEVVYGSGICVEQYLLSESMVRKGNYPDAQFTSIVVVSRSYMPSDFFRVLGSWPARGRGPVPQG